MYYCQIIQFLLLWDVMVYKWVGGKHACVDLTGISSLIGYRI